MAPYDIRLVGDPVLRQPATEVTEIDGRLASLAEDMITTMYEAPGIGLAAPQVGVQKRMFVYDIHDETGSHVIINPVIRETRGEWVFEEGCLSVPDLSWEIVRPAEVHLSAVDLDGNEVSFEASELLARMFLHEVDHLDGVLLLERLDPDQARQAKRTLRDRALAAESEPPRRRLRLPGRA
ncbi:MAG TPA: peptide deformylase [Acidimicrobiales bacterium]|jgi:peptide deformylase|nr:peptide deformylase [Acidimicrobiales bacterium]